MNILHSIPSWLKYPLLYKYQKFQFNRQKESLPEIIRTQLGELSYSKHKPVLLSGYMKSGNTWLRFLIYNYFNILENHAQETLSFSGLNHIQHDSLGDAVSFTGPHKGFPYTIRTHYHYVKDFSLFNKSIYIYRNPLDTLVSTFHFKSQHADPNIGFSDHEKWDIDSFVLHNLKLWELHVNSYLNAPNILIVKYEDLKSDAIPQLRKIITYLGHDFDENIGRKSIEVSSFQNIQKMGREKNEIFGNGGTQFKGEFARKGIVGGYKDSLNQTTIQKAQKILEHFIV